MDYAVTFRLRTRTLHTILASTKTGKRYGALQQKTSTRKGSGVSADELSFNIPICICHGPTKTPRIVFSSTPFKFKNVVAISVQK